MSTPDDSATRAPGNGAGNGTVHPDAEILNAATVMMVDDEPITLDVVQSFLEDAGYSKFITLSDPTMAIPLVAGENPDVLLLDLMMPEVSGFDILKELRANPKYEHLPVIVLTSSTDSETKLRALELGATDFLAKPVDASELVLRLRNTLAAKAYLDRLASYDRLTGLFNREIFGDHIDWAMRLAQRQQRMGALLHINIDRFKKINEALGPALGDAFLQAFAKRMEQGVRSSDTAARIGNDTALPPRLSRLGGDEFAVLLVEVEKTDQVAMIARRFLELMSAAFDIGGHELFMTCSIGISVFPDDASDKDSLIQRAAVALKFAKSQGGNTYSFYSADLNDRSLQLLSLTSELRIATQRNEFRLFYQPKIDTRTRALVGAEALVRWKHPKRGFVSPAEFIPLAEETGIIVDLGAWVIRDACQQISSWLADGLTVQTVSVNISGRQFSHKGFLPGIADLLQKNSFDRHLLQLELTESILMGDVQGNINILNQLRDLGLKLSLDDFGTGYSSLSYLRHFPIDELKIDKSFVKDIGAEGKSNSQTIVIAIIAMARALGLSVVAEGVETEAQAAFLKDQACDQWQGYLFGKPMPAEEFTILLKNQTAAR